MFSLIGSKSFTYITAYQFPTALIHCPAFLSTMYYFKQEQQSMMDTESCILISFMMLVMRALLLTSSQLYWITQYQLCYPRFPSHSVLQVRSSCRMMVDSAARFCVTHTGTCDMHHHSVYVILSPLYYAICFEHSIIFSS